VLSTIVDLESFPFPLFLLCFLNLFEGKGRGDLDLHSYQSNPSLCEGNPLDLDLGEIWCSSSYLFFLSYSPNSFCSFVGI
jgi:hypothetical protein